MIESTSPASSRPPRLIDAAWLLILIVYLFSGLSLIPLHGDETSFIWASQDWFHLTRGDLAELSYAPARDSDPRDLQVERLATGPLMHYLIGFTESVIGFRLDDLPANDWNWDYSLDQNQNEGLVPPPGMLLTGRTASTLGLALSII